MPLKGQDALLPENFDDFRSVGFWDGFFKARRGKAFEWYGSYRQLRPLVAGHCLAQGASVLMLGCGNSELSAELYDDGCTNITNVDFSTLVIKEMMALHLRQRPRMRWMVQDMTATKIAGCSFQVSLDSLRQNCLGLQFGDGSFRVALDKGALDALMGEDNEGAADAGARLLHEVQRVLDVERGVYLCVTLVQPHVLSMLLASFGAGWQLTLHQVPPAPDMATSPLQSFLVVAQRAASSLPDDTAQAAEEADGLMEDVPADGAGGSGGQGAAQVRVTFGPAPKAVNSEQVEDVLKIVSQENKLRAAGHHRGLTRAGSQPTAGSSQAHADHFLQLKPGQHVTVDLPLHSNTSGRQAEGSSGARARFSTAVVDLEGQAAAKAATECAVFLVPQGREHEWLFASEAGQQQVAASCAAKRLVLVTLNRGHTFGDLAAVQAELGPLVVPLAPSNSRQNPSSIPIMTTSEGVGSRARLAADRLSLLVHSSSGHPVTRMVLAEATSPLMGGVCVEDVQLQEADEPERLLRRMVFTGARNLVQSEAVLVPRQQLLDRAAAAEDSSQEQLPAAEAAAASQGKQKRGKGGRAKSSSRQKSAGAATASPPNDGVMAQQLPLGDPQLCVDHSQLSCAYHMAIVAGLSLIADHLQAAVATAQQAAMLAPDVGRAPQAGALAAQAQGAPGNMAGGSEQGQPADCLAEGVVAEATAAQQLAALAPDSAGRAGGSGQGLPAGSMAEAVVAEATAAQQAAALAPESSAEAVVEASLASDAQSSRSASPAQQPAAPGSGAPRALVVGLGGGGLPVFLQQFCGLAVQTVELDPVVVQLAQAHFGFVQSPKLQVTVGDGLEAVATAAQAQASSQQGTTPHSQGQFDVIVVDASSGEASHAMSCPPAAFVQPAFLGHARSALRPGGMLVINCVTRLEEPFQAAVKALKEVFHEVVQLDVPGDVNRVLFGLTNLCDLSPPAAPRKAGGERKPALITLDGSPAAVKALQPKLGALFQRLWADMPACAGLLDRLQKL